MEDYLGILKEAAEEITSKDNPISVKDLAYMGDEIIF
jgi:hypothetical protein